MNYTTNFNLNKPEGTDLYNHLTIDNPNMDIIDAAMQANKLASIGNATELVSGTVHAITRSDSNQSIFKFKATGDFKTGDTITVDGVSVNAYTTGGQQLADDAYVLSAEVICILDATSLWVLVNKDQDASDVEYDNTSSGLDATKVQAAIDELNLKTQRVQRQNTNNVTFTGIPTTCTGLLWIRGYSTNSSYWILSSFSVYEGVAVLDNNPYNPDNMSTQVPSSIFYSAGNLTITLAGTVSVFASIVYAK